MSNTCYSQQVSWRSRITRISFMSYSLFSIYEQSGQYSSAIDNCAVCFELYPGTETEREVRTVFLQLYRKTRMRPEICILFSAFRSQGKTSMLSGTYVGSHEFFLAPGLVVERKLGEKPHACRCRWHLGPNTHAHALAGEETLKRWLIEGGCPSCHCRIDV